MIDQNLLSHKENSTSFYESLRIERAIFADHFHEVNAGEIAGRVIEKHVFAARVACIDPTRIGAGVPSVDRGVVLDTRVTTLPGHLRHSLHDFAGLVFRSALTRIGDPTCFPFRILNHGIHEIVRGAHREVCILEHNGAVGFTVEIRFVATLFNQAMCFGFFFGFALDESIISGCQTFRDCILAARRVFPPLFTTPAI